MTTSRRAARRAPHLAPALLLIAVLVAVLATGCRPQGVVAVRDAQLRPSLAGGNSAAYFTVENRERDTVVVDSVSTGVTAVAELHQTTIDAAGVARMRPAGPLVVPPDSTVTLQPGSLHLMMMKVARQLRAGDRVPLTLWLRDGRRIETRAEVRAP